MGANSTSFAFCVGLLLTCGPLSPASAQCLASTRDVRFSDGSARVKNYVCKLGNAAQPQLRIEFDRLSEAAAGNLLQGEPYPELERVFGKPRVLENAVQAEAKHLFDKFGTKSREESCFRFTVNVGSGGRDYDQKDDSKVPCGKRTLWYLTFPDRLDYTTIQMPLPDEQKYLQEHNDWPRGYNFFYKKCSDGTSLIGCTVIWRPARLADVRDYEKNREAYEKMLNPDPPPEPVAEASDPALKDLEERTKSTERYFTLAEYLGRDGWQDEFLTITGEPSDGGCGDFGFELHIRQLELEVAFVENVSKEVVSLDGLIGAAVSEIGLRKSQQTRLPLSAGTIGIAPVTLAPGQTLAVPLRISFVPAASLGKLFKDQAAARATYNRIQATPRGTVIRQKSQGSGGPPPLRKVRESFGPPTVPAAASFFFGPELTLRGLVLNGQRLEFENAARNFMRLTAGEGYGSCPYLYAWDGVAWVRRGKVIHDANSKEKEASQHISFSGLISKFRLREEELEVSHINRARLALDLADGRRIELHPDAVALVEADGLYATIWAWETLEFEFRVPPDLTPEAVARSTLEITGYYQPYSSMRVGQR
jgi:hypothetical protein